MGKAVRGPTERQGFDHCHAMDAGEKQRRKHALCMEDWKYGTEKEKCLGQLSYSEILVLLIFIVYLILKM